MHERPMRKPTPSDLLTPGAAALVATAFLLCAHLAGGCARVHVRPVASWSAQVEGVPDEGWFTVSGRRAGAVMRCRFDADRDELLCAVDEVRLDGRHAPPAPAR